VRCPQCNNEELILNDVDPKDKVKRYTDSPYPSMYTRTIANNNDSQASGQMLSIDRANASISKFN
jgi:hypothetical protein